MIKIHPALMNYVRPSEHSKYSPSSMDRIISCPFSVKACENIPNETSIYSEEGTCAHSVGEALFYKEYFGIEFPIEVSMEMMKWEKKIPGSIEEMMGCAQTYVNVIAYWLNNQEEIGDVIWYGLEKGVPIIIEDECFGTGDCLIVGTKGAAIIDYKHGKGKSVNADSIQLRSYAAGIAKHLIDVPEDYRYFSIVVQPRTDIAPKVASYTHDQTMEMLATINETIMISRKPDLYPVEGNHCFWCPASRTKDPAMKCPIKLMKPLRLAQENFKQFLEDMNTPVANLTDANPKRDEALIKIMSLAPMIKQIAEDGFSEFQYRLEKGEHIPGIEIKEVLGKRQWVFDDPKAMEAAITTNFPTIEALKIVPATTKLKTITEIEKEVGKGKAEGLTIKKITKKVVIQDEKVQKVLGELVAYGNLVTGTFEEIE